MLVMVLSLVSAWQTGTGQNERQVFKEGRELISKAELMNKPNMQICTNLHNRSLCEYFKKLSREFQFNVFTKKEKKKFQFKHSFQQR